MEVTDEQRLREALAEVLDELQQISDRLSQLNYLELVDLEDHFMPALNAQLADIKTRHEQAEQRRQFVRRLDGAAITDTERMADDLLERIRQRAAELRPAEEEETHQDEPPPLDLDAASDLLAMAFPGNKFLKYSINNFDFLDERPRDVLKRYGFDQVVVDSDEHSSGGHRTEPETMPADDLGEIPRPGPSSHSDFADEAIDDEDLALVSSPEPPVDTQIGTSQGVDARASLRARQRNRWRRVLYAALPYQVGSTQK